MIWIYNQIELHFKTLTLIRHISQNWLYRPYKIRGISKLCGMLGHPTTKQ